MAVPTMATDLLALCMSVEKREREPLKRFLESGGDANVIIVRHLYGGCLL
jgi:hypothetical protein